MTRELLALEVERLLTERVVRSGSEKAPVFMSPGCFGSSMSEAGLEA